LLPSLPFSVLLTSSDADRQSPRAFAIAAAINH